ncbi:UBP-type zinc finger domain-containing protein [Amycolatopsis sp. NPDC023774]
MRQCAVCGHVGCCDSSPGRHARAHAPRPATRSPTASNPARGGSGTTRRK